MPDALGPLIFIFSLSRHLLRRKDVWGKPLVTIVFLMTVSYWHALSRTAHTVYPGSGWQGFCQRALFVLRSFAQHRNSRPWLEYLRQPWMAAIAGNNPSLYRKAIRPYVSKNWSGEMKTAAMIHHYEFLRHQLRPEYFAQIFSPTGADLVVFSVKNGDCLTVRLRYDCKFRKEGETTLELFSEKYRCRVFCLTFVVAADPQGTPCVIIGAISGLPKGTDKNIIKDTSKALFGLRPKGLLLLVLQELAGQWNIPALLGVGNMIHTSRHPAYTLNHSRQFDIVYDEFWQEAGGVRRRDGFFNLPLRFLERPLSAIEPHKRSLYRQRYAWICELQAALQIKQAAWQIPSSTILPEVPARGQDLQDLPLVTEEVSNHQRAVSAA